MRMNEVRGFRLLWNLIVTAGFFFFNPIVLPGQINQDEKLILDVIEEVQMERNPEELRTILQPAIDVSENARDSIRALLFIELGIVHGKLYKNDSSKDYFNEAIRLAERTDQPLIKIQGYNGLGNMVRAEGKNEMAMEYYTKGMNIATDHEGDDFLIWQSKLMSAIAGIYYELGDLEKALEMVSSSLEISIKLKTDFTIAMNYTRLGYLYSAMDSTDLAIKNTLLAQNYLSDLNDTLGLIYNYYSLGSAYMSIPDYSKALNTFSMCADLAFSFSEAETYSSATVQIGRIMLNLNEPQEALTNAETVIAYARSQGLPSKIAEGLMLKSDVLESLGNFRLALENRELYYQMTDSLESVEVQNRINELNTQYETERKEQQIAQLKLENELKDANLAKSRNAQIAILVGSGSLVLILIVTFYLRNKRQKAEKAAQELQIEALKKRIIEVNAVPADLTLDFVNLNEKLHTPLTEREFETLKLTLDGKTNTSISNSLFISVSTVKFHLRNTYTKLGVSNRKEAFEYVVKNS